MKLVARICFTAAGLMILASITAAQDLGSANGLFNAKKKPANSSTKRPAPKKKPASKPTVAKKTPKPTGKRPQAATTSRTTAGKPGREVRTPTGTKVVKPAGPQVESIAKTKPEDSTRFTKFTAPAAQAPDKKVSAADQARFGQLIEEGNAARDDRQYAKAESAYKNARAIMPRDARAIHGLGNVYSDQQRWEEAENAYRAALQLDPSSVATLIALSHVLTQPLPVADLADRYAEAEKLARRATESAPRNGLAFNQLAVAMEVRGDIGSETEAIYRRAIQLDPAFAPSYAYLGRLLRRRGMNDQSKAAYDEAVKRATSVGTMIVVAEVMQSEQRFADSIPLLNDALRTDPKNLSALIMLGHALTVAGRYKDAESTLRRALTVSSNSYRANSLFATLYSRMGAYELAENALLQALRTAPAYENRQLAQQYMIIAQGYAKTGKAEQATRAFGKAAELDPDSGTVSGRFRQ